MIDQRRIRALKEPSSGVRQGPVIYWMSRDQRADDNWALLHAQSIAIQQRVPLIVVFTLCDNFLNAPFRHYSFMLDGLKEVESALERKNIPFFVLKGEPPQKLAWVVKEASASMMVTDFDPLREKIRWKKELARLINIPIYEVDAHNIVPCFFASPKQEFGAYTLRPKIGRLLDEFLTPFPPLKKHPHNSSIKHKAIDWIALEKGLKCDRSIPPVDWLNGGASQAKKTLKKFIATKLSRYAADKNDPSLNGTSLISPYLHFGQISAQRVALTVEQGKEFLEELIVRRELSDNFCFYNKGYDSFEGLPDWGKRTLTRHKNDHRDYLYSLKELEQAKTHDTAWNAAQKEMVTTGHMHGYMRMYWGKKILEWSKSPEEAIKHAVYLNDRYELDGRDPNGYTGILWAIGGLHDRPWGERDIFGMVRYMSFNGLKSKFDIKRYIICQTSKT